MTPDTCRIGRFEITEIIDVEMPDEPMADAFPGLAADALDTARSTYPGIYMDDGRWRLRVRAWLITGGPGPILVDTGIGGRQSPAQDWTAETGRLFGVLAELGTATHDIRTVVISHMHDDHAGGLLADDGQPACPNAEHVIQRADIEWVRTAFADAERAWRPITTIEEAGILRAVDGDHELSPGLSLRHLPGHTPGHQVLIVEDADDRLVLSADTWNHPLQLSEPDGASGSDDDPTAAAIARRQLLADVETHARTIVAPTHFAEPFGTFRRVGDTWIWSAA